MDLITHLFDRRVVAHNEGFAEVGVLPFSVGLISATLGKFRVMHDIPFGVYSHELQFLPASLHYVLNAKVELA